jgi:FtsP/CotA-like multicopper oxidase with cupredoxin domain
LNERPANRLSYHTDFTANPNDPQFRNPLTGRGPIEGRPPGEVFAHQRWSEFFPKVGYVSSWAGVLPDTSFTSELPGPGHQQRLDLRDRHLRAGNAAAAADKGPLWRADPAAYLQQHAGQPHPEQRLRPQRDAAALPQRAQRGGERRRRQCAPLPRHLLRLPLEHDAARRDKINAQATDPRASGPDGKGGLVNVAGDFRELQGTMWAHDHRFSFTAENGYKGALGMVNYYSGPDRGNEDLEDGINLRLPSGSLLDSGNLDFDVNLVVSDSAFDPDGQYFFDIFTTDGFLGDVPLVNFAYAPVFEVLPRKYRFRILNACMSRFLQPQLADPNGGGVPFQFVANDGNLVVNPTPLTTLDQQGIGERYDIVVDFSTFPVGSTLHLVNTLVQTDGRLPSGRVSLTQALRGVPADPMVGPVLQFRVVDHVFSVDVPGVLLRTTDPDPSQVSAVLTEQIPVVTPVRTRVITWANGEGDSRQRNGQCTPDCPPKAQFPWVVSVDGGQAHSLNANRVSLLIPKPGDVEHWTYVNDGGEWDHPIHLHFEEGVTMNRGGAAIPATEKLVRKDVWRLRPDGRVQFQVQFGEYGGAYVQHCHNTGHEDFAMLMRIQILNGIAGTPQAVVTQTPNPTPDGVVFTAPEVLKEA